LERVQGLGENTNQEEPETEKGEGGGLYRLIEWMKNGREVRTRQAS